MKLHVMLPAMAGLALTSLPSLAQAAPACGTENLLAGKAPVVKTDIKGDVALVTDGKVGPEGTQWDAPVAVTFDSAKSALIYDLGEPRQVGALFAQADANDTYVIAGALENNPASFKPLTTLANVVVDRGHGLRTRNVEITPATVRYIRFGDGVGDGYFSISELGVYCKTPSPWPPTNKIVEAPPAATPADAHTPPKPSNSSDGGRSALLLGVAALGLAWLAYRTIKRSGSTSPPPASGPPTTEGTTTEDKDPDQAAPSKEEPPKSA